MINDKTTGSVGTMWNFTLVQEMGFICASENDYEFQ